MKTVFADACYWIALLNPRDQLHQKARDVSETLGACRIVTSEMTLTEFLNGLSGFGPHMREKAVRTVRSLENSPNVEVVPQTSHQFRKAVEKYSSTTDMQWGITDCSSFCIMEERGLTEALTHDHHFEQASYRALLRDDP